MENNFVNNLFSAGGKSVRSAFCPNCGNKLEYEGKDQTVVCFCCDSAFSPDQLTDRPGSTATVQAGGISPSMIAQLIDSPDDGLIYVQNFLDNMDWDQYAESTEILLPELEEMVVKNKIKFGANGAAWLLDFESVAKPLGKKLEGLGKIAARVASHFADEDKTDALVLFDLYKSIYDAVYDSKDALTKRLQSDVVYAENLDLDGDALLYMKQALQKLSAQLDGMEAVKEIYDIPEVKEEQKRLNEEKVKEFASRGLVVRDIYAKAEKMYADPKANRNELVQILETIRGYENVNKMMAAVNRYYQFDKFFNFCGKSFIYKSERKEAIFDPKAGKKGEPALSNGERDFSGVIYSLYEVIGGKPAKEPKIKDITEVLTVRGARLYYVKLGSALCYYDFVDDRVCELDHANVGDYNTKACWYNFSRTALFLRKRLPVEEIAKGCFKKNKEIVERRNNYSIIKINLMTDTVTTAVPELLDVTEHYGSHLFYMCAEEKPKTETPHHGKKLPLPTDQEKEKIKQHFRMYDMEDGKDQELLDPNCEICKVIDNYVVFCRFSPNDYNRDLYVYNITTGEETLIEANIFEFRFEMKGLLYYTVGNDDYCPLFSNDVTGNNRVEIMTNVERIVAQLAGWIYVLRGRGRNATLIKVSKDGKRRMVVCTQFKSAIKVTETFIYYLDASNALRVVRADGKDNVLIAENISSRHVIVDKQCIYYLRKEAVDDRGEDQASLYRMDLDGHNVRKLVFNVTNISNFDENTIILARSEKALFEFTIPVDNKNDTTKERRFYTLEHYCKYDKKTGTIGTLLTLGLPDESDYEFKKGCFGKTVKLHSSYERVPVETVYLRKNVAKAGAVLDEQVHENEVREEQRALALKKPDVKLPDNGCCGCGKKK